MTAKLGRVVAASDDCSSTGLERDWVVRLMMIAKRRLHYKHNIAIVETCCTWKLNILWPKVR